MTASVTPLASTLEHASTDDIIVGKDVLELLTGAMYVDPLSIYREYVQNACDAVDDALDTGVIASVEEAPISIRVDQAQRSVIVTDSACGVPESDFFRRLTAIGASKKRGTSRRGFRGVGRLSGLGYCQELLFRSRASGSSPVMEMRWDGRRLRAILRDKNYEGSLSDLIAEVTSVTTLPSAEWPEHFFEVELRKIVRVKNDVLMNEREIRAYLSQVAPVPFRSDFSFGRALTEQLTQRGLGQSYVVALSDDDTQIYRPFADEFPISEAAVDRFVEVRCLDIEDMDGSPGAFMWLLDHSYFGSIPKRALIGGLRVRAGNVQIGSSEILADGFPETRFNGWCVGELHIISPRIVPNGRRDQFETSAALNHLLGRLAPEFAKLAKLCRAKSTTRNRRRSAHTALEQARKLLDEMEKGTHPEAAQAIESRTLSLCASARKAALALVEAEQDAVIYEAARLESKLHQLSQRFAQAALQQPVPQQVPLQAVFDAVFDVLNDPQQSHAVALRILQKLAQ